MSSASDGAECGFPNYDEAVLVLRELARVHRVDLWHGDGGRFWRLVRHRPAREAPPPESADV